MKDKSKMSNIPNVISAKAILLKERRLVLNVVELDSINGTTLDDIINSVGRATELWVSALTPPPTARKISFAEQDQENHMLTIRCTNLLQPNEFMIK